MAKKKIPKRKTSNRKPKAKSGTSPKFKYTNTPNSLRKFLRLVPDKPRPSKVNNDLLKSWGICDSNANTIIRVLKSIDLVGSNNEPTDHYTSFMQPNTGPATLGAQIRIEFDPLFETSHEPFNESNEDIKRLFNIHSGGSEGTINYQIQTFKVLCEFAKFDSDSVDVSPNGGQPPNNSNGPGNQQPPAKAPPIHIDLHIHLPENKATRDYQAIIEDIARYIYRHEDFGDG